MGSQTLWGATGFSTTDSKPSGGGSALPSPPRWPGEASHPVGMSGVRPQLRDGAIHGPERSDREAVARATGATAERGGVVTPAELRAKYQRLAQELVPGTLAPAAEVYRQFARELEELTGIEAAPIYVDTDQAAATLAVSPKTVANWCNAGRFPGARKTGGRGGKWTIPVQAIREYQRKEVAV